MPRLRRSDPSTPGIARRRRGRGFSYVWTATGETVADSGTLGRIAGLVIPPAWSDVWISPWPHGHIQAVGTDAAGRRQYLYHERWRERRDAEKFRRALELGTVLPEVRRRVADDMARGDLGEEAVLATAVRLLDVGCFRVGGEVYAREHETFGVATIRREHVKVGPGEVTFRYPGKGSIMGALSVHDPQVAAAVGPLRRRRGGSGQLLAYRRAGGWVDVHSRDINAYLKSVAGERFSAKDFRTWSGTVYAAVVLAGIDPVPASARGRKKAITCSVREVAEYLGNTPAVCRSSYIDPRVIDHFEAGGTIAVAIAPGAAGTAPGMAAPALPAGPDEAWERRAAAEQAVIAFLRGGAPEEEAAA